MDFSMQLSQKLGLRLEQKLAPQLIQSMELLQLPMMELLTRIDQELQENPALELVENIESPVEPASVAETELTEAEEEVFKKLDSMDGEWDQYFKSTLRPRQSGDEADVNQALANTAAAPETLQEYISEQIRLIDLSDELGKLAEAIIYSIDDSGYLRYPLKDAVESLDGTYTIRQAREVLRIIQNVGPPGVGARNITECLLLQLNGAEEDFTLEKLLITFHLKDIQNNKLPRIARETGRTIEDVKDAVDCITHLHPRPGETVSSSHAQYIVPDMVVKYVDGRYEIALQDNFFPNIRVSPFYLKMMKSDKRDPTVLKYVRSKIGAAGWIVSSLEQRRNTLQRIGNEIVSVQQGFFEEGASGLKPLRMQDVADTIGVHVATVSRAVSGKYIDTPRGIYRLKFFFTGGIETVDGHREARHSVEEELKALIDSEDKRHPISDGEIVKELKGKGIEMARRTVAKYRTQMNIPSSARRKEH